MPKVALPYPIGRHVAGRFVSKISPTLYQIDLSGKIYTAEVSSERLQKKISPGDPVHVRVVSKLGAKAFLEIIEPDFPDVLSPGPADIAKLAMAAGWPDDAASKAAVAALVARRLPLRSELAGILYNRLKPMAQPTAEDAEKFLSDLLLTPEA